MAELSLLCTEETNFVDDEEDINNEMMIVEKTEIGGGGGGGEISIAEMGFPIESEEIIQEMMVKELQHLPRHDYINRLRTGDLDLNVRRQQALNWIWKACELHQFGLLCICLSVNYLDRFLSVHDLPVDQAWILQLLAVACLSLAAKIEESDVPLLIDLQVGNPQFVFEPRSVQRMELLVLNRLKWRLRPITPCSYIRYFLRLMSRCDEEPSNTLISTSLQVIANTTKGIDLLEFRPCEVAAAVALSVSGELHTVHFDNSPLFSLLQKERVKKIVEMIESDGSGISSQTPNGVLEVSASCFSTKTHDSSSSSYTHLS